MLDIDFASSCKDPLFVDVYDRLKAMASRHRLRSGSPKTFCTTELVHEAYVRMGDSNGRFDLDAKFFAYAACAMRHILTDAARRRNAPMHGGDQVRIDFDETAGLGIKLDPQMAVQLDEALMALEKDDARAARVLELHYFAGLDLQEIANMLGIVRRTVDRDWRYARAFLAARA